MIKISKHQQKKLLKLANINGSLSASEYKNIVKPKAKKQKSILSMSTKDYKEYISNINTSSGNQNDLVFNFKYEIELIENGYIARLIGKHYSRNVTKKWHRGTLIRYGKAIKNAMRIASIEYKKLLDKIKPYKKANIVYIYYMPYSRDNDNHSETKKIFQDTLTISSAPNRALGLGFIEDDKIINIGQPIEKEVLQKKYMIEAIITRKFGNC